MFCARVGAHGRRGETARELGTLLADRPSNTNVDTLPLGVWDLVKSERMRAGFTERQFQLPSAKAERCMRSEAFDRG